MPPAASSRTSRWRSRWRSVAGRLAPPGGELRDPLLRTPAQLGRRPRAHARADQGALRAPRPPQLPPPERRDSRPARRSPARTVRAARAARGGARAAARRAGARTGHGRRRHERRRSPALAAEVDLDGIRPHRPGTAASRIAWPIYARRGELHDRVLRAESDSRPLIVLDLRGTADERPTRRRRARGGVARRSSRAARRLCAAAARRAPAAGDRRGAARLAAGARAPGAGEAGAGRRSAPPARAAALVIWVAARALPSRRAGSCAAPASRARARRARSLPGRRASFTVAGCTGYVLGSRAAIAHARRRSASAG